MKIGFTGTREGTTDQQRRALIAWAKTAGVTEFHHGCCLGADEDAFDVFMSAGDLGFARPVIIAHPPANRSMLCRGAEEFSDEKRSPLPYLERNKCIVDACDVLVACPKEPEELRSGTWSTVRYARKQGKKVVIIWADGETTYEESL